MPSSPLSQPLPIGEDNVLQPPTASDWAFYHGHIAAITVCTVVTTSLVVMRFFVKWRTRTKWLADDYTCIVAWFAYMGYASTSFAGDNYGLGLHSWQVSPDQIMNINMWLYGSAIAYCPTTYIIKVTLLILIARVFAVMHKVRRGIQIFMVALFVAYVPVQMIKIFICTPIRADWDSRILDAGEGHCLNLRKVFIVDLSLAILTDLVVLVLPIALVWNYSFSWRKKVKIACLLGAGGAAVGLTAYRMYYVVRYVESVDTTYDAALLDILCFLELTLGLICACIPTLNIFIARKRQKSRSNPHTIDDPNKLNWAHIRPPVQRYFWRPPAAAIAAAPQKTPPDDIDFPRTIGSHGSHSKASRIRRYREEHMEEWWADGSVHNTHPRLDRRTVVLHLEQGGDGSGGGMMQVSDGVDMDGELVTIPSNVYPGRDDFERGWNWEKEEKRPSRGAIIRKMGLGMHTSGVPSPGGEKSPDREGVDTDIA